MAVILADIGGTHARFSFLDGEELSGPEIYTASDFPSLYDALQAYIENYDPGGDLSLYIATAAQPDSEGRWSFLRNNSWIIDIGDLTARGFKVETVINDFAASARGTLSLPGEGLVTLKEAPVRKMLPRVVIGPGTGLGLSWMAPLGPVEGKGQVGWHVQETYGGHMAMPAVTDEQHDIIALVRGMKQEKRIVVPENLVSGRSLPFLYAAVCKMRGENPEDLPHGKEAVRLIFSEQTEAQRDTRRLFFEFLGLFAHLTVITVNGFGGLYLEGGILKYLYGEDRFDFDSFERFFILDTVPVVYNDLAATPIFLIRDPYAALHGLKDIVIHDS